MHVRVHNRTRRDRGQCHFTSPVPTDRICLKTQSLSLSIALRSVYLSLPPPFPRHDTFSGGGDDEGSRRECIRCPRGDPMIYRHSVDVFCSGPRRFPFDCGEANEIIMNCSVRDVQPHGEGSLIEEFEFSRRWELWQRIKSSMSHDCTSLIRVLCRVNFEYRLV